MFSLRIFKKILPHTHILFVNKEEAELLTGKKNTIPLTIAALHKQGVRTVVITDGKDGSYASDGEQILHLAIYTSGQPPVSKTGAGDAYAAGFLAAYMEDKDISTCMQWGNANSYGVIQEMGAQAGQCTEAEIGTIIKRFSRTVPVALT